MLTHVCVILIDFQAHRDAFIQNDCLEMSLNVKAREYLQKCNYISKNMKEIQYEKSLKEALREYTEVLISP